MSFQKGEILANINPVDEPTNIFQGIAIEAGPPATVQDENGNKFTLTEDDYIYEATGSAIKHADLLANGKRNEALHRLGLEHDCKGKLFANKKEIEFAYLKIAAKHRNALLAAFTSGMEDAAAEMFLELAQGGAKADIANNFSYVNLNENGELECDHCEQEIATSNIVKAGHVKLTGKAKQQFEVAKGAFGSVFK